MEAKRLAKNEHKPVKGEKRLTASEKEALVRLNVALEILTTEPEHLAQRAALIPGAKRDMAMMAAKIFKLLGGFADTIPADQLLPYRRALMGTSYMIGMKKPGVEPLDEKNYGMWLPYEVLNALIAGCHDHCMMCNLDKVGRKQCPLRKALDTIPNDSEPLPDGDCQFYTLM